MRHLFVFELINLDCRTAMSSVQAMAGRLTAESQAIKELAPPEAAVRIHEVARAFGGWCELFERLLQHGAYTEKLASQLLRQVHYVDPFHDFICYYGAGGVSSQHESA